MSPLPCAADRGGRVSSITGVANENTMCGRPTAPRSKSRPIPSAPPGGPGCSPLQTVYQRPPTIRVEADLCRLCASDIRALGAVLATQPKRDDRELNCHERTH